MSGMALPIAAETVTHHILRNESASRKLLGDETFAPGGPRLVQQLHFTTGYTAAEGVRQ
jgi:hypothetical protein